ncbi:hypothetical protein [Streptomyces sp. CMB-StM0423]|nr:hypothetical protein [Streptomyces sp. CMB-StM0423]
MLDRIRRRVVQPSDAERPSHAVDGFLPPELRVPATTNSTAG